MKGTMDVKKRRKKELLGRMKAYNKRFQKTS